MHGLLFDLGGTFLRAGLAAPGSAVRFLGRTRIASVADGLDEREIWEGITAAILACEAEHRSSLPDDAPVVLSFPGPIAEGARVIQAPTVAGGSTAVFDLPWNIRRATGRRVIILNDVSAAAWQLAETRKARRFLVVTVSSGIGSKMFDRCHAAGVFDRPAHAGEIGHVVVDDSPDAPVCDCGGQGHLGAIASGRAIERLLRGKAITEPDRFRSSLCSTVFGATASHLNNEDHIVPAVLAGDCWATGVVKSSTRPLVRCLLSVAMAAGLEKIFVIGGFATALGSCYLEILREQAHDLCRYAVFCEQIDELFEVISTGEETCLAGCAAFLRQRRAAL